MSTIRWHIASSSNKTLTETRNVSILCISSVHVFDLFIQKFKFLYTENGKRNKYIGIVNNVAMYKDIDVRRANRHQQNIER